MTLLRSEKERRTGLDRRTSVGRDMMQRAVRLAPSNSGTHAKSCPPRPAILSPLAILLEQMAESPAPADSCRVGLSPSASLRASLVLAPQKVSGREPSSADLRRVGC